MLTRFKIFFCLKDLIQEVHWTSRPLSGRQIDISKYRSIYKILRKDHLRNDSSDSQTLRKKSRTCGSQSTSAPPLGHGLTMCFSFTRHKRPIWQYFWDIHRDFLMVALNYKFNFEACARNFLWSSEKNVHTNRKCGIQSTPAPPLGHGIAIVSLLHKTG